jgi:hypothetical protein
LRHNPCKILHRLDFHADTVDISNVIAPFIHTAKIPMITAFLHNDIPATKYSVYLHTIDLSTRDTWAEMELSL